MADQANNTVSKKETPLVPWTEFLELHPPGRPVHVSGLIELKHYGNRWEPCAKTPEINLYCDDSTCEGMRLFEYVEGNPLLNAEDWIETFWNYRCKNCEKTFKRFALALRTDKLTSQSITSGIAFKFGEMPPFGPPVPPRLISLIGPDKDIFLTGRRAEGQGMGIGAFTYYRRVLVNQKNRILEEVAKVAEKTGLAPGHIAILRKAKEETQFSKAMDMVKTAIPSFLLINSHNPLTLLHSALSEGLHDKTDEECLQLATSIRIVLTELAERISQALKDEATLRQAVSHLLQSKSGDVNPSGK
jgi:hypothetical protein